MAAAGRAVVAGEVDSITVVAGVAHGVTAASSVVAGAALATGSQVPLQYPAWPHYGGAAVDKPPWGNTQ
jgi:hypothetical protein